MASISRSVSLSLPQPWNGGLFNLNRLEPVMFLVGPNGSGKSRFADVLRHQLPSCRLLGTDRLSGMEKNRGLGFLGDNFAAGFQKSWFQNFKNAGITFGSGIDTIPLLEERLDIRIKVEATLSHLFNRSIRLEWDSGNLVPKAVLGTSGAEYRLDSEECHGIKELLVLLTHLYNEQHQHLIVDEPELNLHPQFQSFFMQEVRKMAGNPDEQPGKKVVILITHSPFMLDFRSVSDLSAVISFSINHEVPRTISDLDANELYKLTSLVSRVNVYHKQLFFSDNPIFVEGIFDSQMIQAIQEARGASIASAGSCIIDVGGCEEVNKYVTLCHKFGKKAHFVYDLDSLFTGTLRGCVREDERITSFLASLGLSSDFARYCGELDKLLGDVIQSLKTDANRDVQLDNLMSHIHTLEDRQGKLVDQRLSQARVAVLVQIAKDRRAIVRSTSESTVTLIEGRLRQIVEALKQRNIFLLANGALENYLPSYDGGDFRIDENLKSKAVQAEIEFLASPISAHQLKERYGGLYDVVCALPSKEEVDFESVLMDVLSQLIHDLQTKIVRHPNWSIEQMRASLFKGGNEGRGRIFDIESLIVREDSTFHARLIVKRMFGTLLKYVDVSHLTNAGMRNFELFDYHN